MKNTKRSLLVVLVIQWIRLARVPPEHLSDLLARGTQENLENLENPDSTDSLFHI